MTAIVLGLALALHHDRAPAALVNFMGVYWIITFQWGRAAEAHAADYRSQRVRSGPRPERSWRRGGLEFTACRYSRRLRRPARRSDFSFSSIDQLLDGVERLLERRA